MRELHSGFKLLQKQDFSILKESRIKPITAGPLIEHMVTLQTQWELQQKGGKTTNKPEVRRQKPWHTAVLNLSASYFNAALTTSLSNTHAHQHLLTDWKAQSHLRAVMSHSPTLISPSPFPSALSPVVLPAERSVGSRWMEESLLLMSNTEDCCLRKVN